MLIPYEELIEGICSIGAVNFNGCVDYYSYQDFCDMYNNAIEEARKSGHELRWLQYQYMELMQDRDCYKAKYEGILNQLCIFFQGACEPINPQDATGILPWDD